MDAPSLLRETETVESVRRGKFQAFATKDGENKSYTISK